MELSPKLEQLLEDELVNIFKGIRQLEKANKQISTLNLDNNTLNPILNNITDTKLVLCHVMGVIKSLLIAEPSTPDTEA